MKSELRRWLVTLGLAWGISIAGVPPIARSYAQSGENTANATERPDASQQSDGSATPVVKIVRRQPENVGNVPALPETEVVAQQTPPTPPPEPFQAPVSPFQGTFYDSPFSPPIANGYAGTSAVIGTLSNTPLIRLPQSVQVVTRDLLNDVNAINVSDAYRFSSGVNQTADSIFSYSVRGFTTSVRRWNGFNDTFGAITPYDTQDIQRIEFVKGPAAVLYGASNPGGFMSFTTKKPLTYDYGRVDFTSGSFGLARPTLDVNRRIGENTYARINVALQSADSFRDFVQNDRLLVNPSITHAFNEDVRLTVEGQFYNLDTLDDTGIFPINGNFHTLPRSRLLNDPSDRYVTDSGRIAAFLDMDLTENWSMRVATQGFWAKNISTSHVPYGPTTPSGLTLQYPFGSTRINNYQTIIANSSWKTEIAGRDNELITGTEVLWAQNPVNSQVGGLADLYFLDAFNPNYQNSFPNVPTFIDQTNYTNNQAFFIQDGFQLSDRIRLLGGARYDNYDRKIDDRLAADVTTVNDHRWTPRGAVLFEAIPDTLSAWYSYTESFNVNQGILYSGNPLDPNGGALRPSVGKQHEIGWKLAETNNFILTNSFFHIDQTNIPVAGPFGLSVQSGLVRSQGIEFDLFGRLTDRWSLTSNYAYIDARTISDTDPANVGQRFVNVPYNTANVWSRYNFVDRQIPGRGRQVFGLALGMVWVSSNVPFVQFNPFGLPIPNVPSYTRMDGGAYYQQGRFFSNMYLENITDVTYFTAGASYGYRVGNPFTVRLTMGLTF